MTHEIIKVKNYLLVVDDSEIKDGDYVYDLKDKVIRYVKKYLKDDWIKKIIAHLPLNNSPILEGVDVLPLLDDEDDYVYEDGYNVLSHKRGYDKAKEKYKYTNEDMLVIRNQLVTMLPVGDVAAWDMIQAISKYKKWLDDYVESLSQPKTPIAFECEVVVLRERPTDIRNHINDETYEVPKTTTNNLGQTQWVGKYIYA